MLKGAGKMKIQSTVLCILLVGVMFVVTGCAPRILSRAEITTMANGDNPRYRMLWRYKGTDDLYHYFSHNHHTARGYFPRDYRASRDQLSFYIVLPRTSNPENWAWVQPVRDNSGQVISFDKLPPGVRMEE